MFKIAALAMGSTQAYKLEDASQNYFKMTEGMMMALGYSPEQIVNGNF